MASSLTLAAGCSMTRTSSFTWVMRLRACTSAAWEYVTSPFVYHSEPASWEGARAVCQAEGGDLASIHTEAENAVAYELSAGQSVWLGLTDAAEEGVWTWSDGSPLDYTPSAGEGFRYDNHGGDEDCAGFWSGRWGTAEGGPAEGGPAGGPLHGMASRYYL